MASPYAPGADDFSPDDLGPRRTSVLAIISLILSLICIIPGAGVLGAIFGLAALIGITQSKGRVGGTGLAVVGLLLGLLFSALWVGGAVGAARFYGMVKTAAITPVRSTMTALEAGDYTAARAAFTPAFAATVTDDQLARFRDAVHAENGAFKSIPERFLEVVQGGKRAGPAFHTFGKSNLQNVIPLPAEFDKGWGIVVIQMPRQMKNPKTILIDNLAVFTVDGSKQIWLDEARPGRPGPAVPPVAAPETPAATPEVTTPAGPGAPAPGPAEPPPAELPPAGPSPAGRGPH